jgi:hypothetical protein
VQHFFSGPHSPDEVIHRCIRGHRYLFLRRYIDTYVLIHFYHGLRWYNTDIFFIDLMET